MENRIPVVAVLLIASYSVPTDASGDRFALTNTGDARIVSRARISVAAVCNEIGMSAASGGLAIVRGTRIVVDTVWRGTINTSSTATGFKAIALVLVIAFDF